MPAPVIKPNGQPVGTLKVSVDDGYCEWEYLITFPEGAPCIHKAVVGMCKHFGAELHEGSGRLRTTHHEF